MPADLLRRVDKIERAIDQSRRDTVRAAARAAQEAQEDVMRADVGGDLRLSRVRSGRGARIGARVLLTGDSAEIQALGPVPLIANPTPPHPIPRRGKVGRVALPIAGEFRATAQHPGTRGKDTWNRGRDRARSKSSTVVERRTDDVVRHAFHAGP